MLFRRKRSFVEFATQVSKSSISAIQKQVEMGKLYFACSSCGHKSTEWDDLSFDRCDKCEAENDFNMLIAQAYYKDYKNKFLAGYAYTLDHNERSRMGIYTGEEGWYRFAKTITWGWYKYEVKCEHCNNVVTNMYGGTDTYQIGGISRCMKCHKNMCWHCMRYYQQDVPCYCPFHKEDITAADTLYLSHRNKIPLD